MSSCRRFTKHGYTGFSNPSTDIPLVCSLLYSALIHFLPGFATPPGSQLHSIPKNNLCIFEIYPWLCVLRMEHSNNRVYFFVRESEREMLYAEIGLKRCRKSRVDVLWIFISSRERPRDAVASASVKVTGEKKPENRLFLPF